MTSIKEQKRALRSELRSKLHGLSSLEKQSSDTAICEQVLALPEYIKANTIFAYIGVNWEIDTKPILLHALESGKRVAIPLCVDKGIMEARFITEIDDLIPGYCGIKEPKKDSPICKKDEIDFAIIPCVSCSPSCERLGQGGGFYDRFLLDASCPNAALCREIALTTKIPMDPWDERVDMVVTETDIWHSF